MALGTSQNQQRFENPRDLLGDRLVPGSLYRLLADHGHTMFPDDYFADLYSESVRGRPTVPARVMATAMLLQAFEGLSDREACDRLGFDLFWQAAAGLDTAAKAFHPTVLPGQRNRLRASDRPRRLFEDTKVVAKATGAMKGRARVLDSTPVYDAVATEDTVTQLRASIRKLLRALDQDAGSLATKLFSWDRSRWNSRITWTTTAVMRLALSESKGRSSMRPTRSSLSAATSPRPSPSSEASYGVAHSESA